MQGLHLTGDLYACACSAALLTDPPMLTALCRDAAGAAGLTIVDQTFHGFPERHGQPGGITGALLLAESHLAVHTWPERQGVTLDVFVCNFGADNSAMAQALFDALVRAFRPRSQTVNRILRGDVAAAPGAAAPGAAAPVAPAEPGGAALATVNHAAAGSGAPALQRRCPAA
jgi:spermidine synthase